MTMLRSLVLAAAVFLAAAPAQAQTLNIIRGIDAPQYDGAKTSSGAMRVAAFAELHQIVDREALWVQLVDHDLSLVANKRVKNLLAHHVYGSLIYKGLDLAP